MTPTDRAQAVLLLTSRFSRHAGADSAKPLTNTEWGRLAEWLRSRDLGPELLLGPERGRILDDWADARIDRPRLEALLDRGSALAMALDRWLGAGLWIHTRGEPEYPERLKRRLGTASPAVLYGCGDPAVAGAGGLAVVGSRKAPPEDLEWSRILGERAAAADVPVVSGAARGVDQAAMRGALEAGGRAVGVIANDLLRATTVPEHRERLLEGALTLVSPYPPEAGFSVGNAMGRNRYVYCLSDGAVAVHSGKKGGTWSGATENLKRGWVPLWVRGGSRAGPGNGALAERGARTLGDDPARLDVRDLLAAGYGESAKTSGPAPGVRESGLVEARTAADELFERFLELLRSRWRGGEARPDDLARSLDLTRPQLDRWLKRAVEEGRLRKRTRPVRYEWAETDSAQLALFD